MRACNQLHAGSDIDVLWAGLGVTLNEMAQSNF
jgi:hypothetical protein